MENLIIGDFRSNLDLLRWLKSFYTTNAKDEEYDPVKARDNLDISPAQQCGKNHFQSLTPRQGTNKTLLFPPFRNQKVEKSPYKEQSVSLQGKVEGYVRVGGA